MNGNNIIVYKNGTAIAGAKSAEISTSAGVIEVASATSGEWREFIAGRKEWSLSCGYLITANSGVRDLLRNLAMDSLSTPLAIMPSMPSVSA